MTYTEVAAKHGWTYEKKGIGPSNADHVFHNGELRLAFHRRGHGHWHIHWRGRVVPWPRMTRPGSDQSLSPTWIPGEEFADVALPQITVKECLHRIGARLRACVADARADLARAEKNLAEFTQEINQPPKETSHP